MIGDPLSRSRQVWSKLIAWTFAVMALTALAIWGLAPVKSDRLADWPRIVGSSFLYMLKCWAYLVDARSLQAFRHIDLLPFMHGSLTLAGITVTLILIMATAVAANERNEYGESRYARAGDLKEMELTGKLGPVLGRAWGRLLLPKAPRSTLVIAPTRTGKTRGCVIPTILTYPGSMVIVDPKGELIDTTADALRARGHSVYVLEWTNPNSPSGWNPVGEDLPKTETAIEIALNRQAAMFYPKSDRGGDADYWKDNARRNYVALAMFEVYEAQRTGRAARLDNVANALMKFATIEQEEDSDPFGDMLKSLAKEAIVHGYPARISDDLLFFSSLHYKERSAHINTLVTGLQLFRTQAVAAVTGRSDFSLEQLRQRPTAIYIKFNQADAKAFGPLTAIFLESVFAWALDTPSKKKDQSILIVGEEWASLPVIPLTFDALAKGNGMGLHLMVVLQDLAQFKEKYKQEGVDQLITNCTYIVAFAQANKYTADTLTALVGKVTRQKRTFSKQGDKLFGSTNSSQEGVPLIRPEQWGEIRFGYVIVLVQRHFTRPIFCRSAFWDKDRRMRRMMKRGGR